MWKWATIILAALLIGSNAIWLYGAIDLAVTEKYRQQIEYERENQIEALVKLNNQFVVGKDKNELKDILINIFPDFEPYEKESHLNTLWLSFEIGEDDKIKALK